MSKSVPKRILLSPSAYYPSLGGVEEICRNLACKLTDAGYEVAVATNRHPLNLPEKENLFGVDVRRFDFYYPALNPRQFLQSWRSLLAMIRFERFVSEWKPDIVHVICPSSNALYCWMAQLLRPSKLLVTFQGELFMDENGIYDRSRLFRAGLQKLLSVASGVTACSQYVLTDAKHKYKISQTIQKVIFNGVDVEEASLAKSTVHDRAFILGLGRLVGNKGFDVLIEAFYKIHGGYPHVDLLIVGEGAMRGVLQEMIRSKNLQHRVQLTGRKGRTEVADYFASCLFFVMPSPVEPFGIVCLEAMRAGKPVLATDAGGPPEFVTQNSGGLLVPPRDSDSLADALRKLLDDAQLRQAMGQAGQARIREFDWKCIAEQYARVYLDLFQKP